MRHESEMVKRVAKAIALGRGLDEGQWMHFVASAKAAIEAMREPTFAMRKVSTFEAAEIDWPKMIDAALSPERGKVEA